MKYRWILGLLIALGLVLRMLGARGDLWVDEIWTLALVAPLKNGFEVFWNISHDNNHFLNSLWMFQWGQDASSLLYRLPSILCGVASVAVAARIGSRDSPAAGLIAAFLVAVAFPFVNYGSEARGYGALVLAMLVALDACERATPLLGNDEGQTESGSSEIRRQSWIMALAVGVGALAHLEMLIGAATLGLTALVRALAEPPRDEAPRRLRATVKFFLPALFLTLPAIAAVIAGIVIHGVTIGGLSRGAGAFAEGYGGLLAALAGFPATFPGWLALLLAALGFAAAALAGWLPLSRALLVLCGLVVVPASIFFVNPPNLQFPRYFLVFGVIFVVALAALASRLWETRRGKAFVFAAGLLFCVGQAIQLQPLLRGGRGEASAMIAIMAEQPHATYASQIRRASEYVLDYYSRRAGLDLRRVSPPATCAERPDFYIVGVPIDLPIAEEKVTIGPEACLSVYVQAFDAAGSSLSGMHWRLFRPAGEGAASAPALRAATDFR
ncbi:hypothetical protein [Rhodoblastus sp.]|jgi:hypothetical protein|uniref:hypothetical protein n=1 Tax=Rhodoblastus sp. TaxID=1962975 RepID=UPI0025CFDAE8|nr:hypothetical protein [Rhodoblastus sp.]